MSSRTAFTSGSIGVGILGAVTGAGESSSSSESGSARAATAGSMPGRTIGRGAGATTGTKRRPPPTGRAVVGAFGRASTDVSGKRSIDGGGWLAGRGSGRANPSIAVVGGTAAVAGAGPMCESRRSAMTVATMTAASATPSPGNAARAHLRGPLFACASSGGLEKPGGSVAATGGNDPVTLCATATSTVGDASAGR